MTLAIPPITNEDRLPHTRAVWRDTTPHPMAVQGRQVSVDYGDGLIEQTTGENVRWDRVTRWRWGWAPTPSDQAMSYGSKE